MGFPDQAIRFLTGVLFSTSLAVSAARTKTTNRTSAKIHFPLSMILRFVKDKDSEVFIRRCTVACASLRFPVVSVE
jgi:hypothetical protein